MKDLVKDLDLTNRELGRLEGFTDIQKCYDLWRARGAKFITEPKVHQTEMCCYMRDPDGYLIEVGQTTMIKTPPELYR
jgi:hypothetical protein